MFTCLGFIYKYVEIIFWCYFFLRGEFFYFYVDIYTLPIGFIYSMPSSRLSASPQLNRQSRLGEKTRLFGFLWFYQQFERLWNFGNLNSKYSPVYMLMVGWEGKSFLEFCLKKMWNHGEDIFKKLRGKKQFVLYLFHISDY